MEVSYNGWRASANRGDLGIVAPIVAGVSFPGGVKSGPVATVLNYVAEQFNARVEKLVPGWCWGWNYRQNRNANNLSCHSSGTAYDFNAPRHPNGRRGTFSPQQVATIRAILREVGGVVQWGGDFTGTADEMHFEILGNAEKVARVAADLGGGNTAINSQSVPPSDNAEDFLMALSQYQQEETHNAVVDINNRTADMAVAIKGLTDAVNAIAAALKVPDMPFNWLPALNNKLDAITEAVKKEAK